MEKLKFSSTLSLIASFLFSIITIYNCIHNFVSNDNSNIGIYAFPHNFSIGAALESYGSIFVAFAFQYIINKFICVFSLITIKKLQLFSDLQIFRKLKR